MSSITHHELAGAPQLLDQHSSRALAEVLAATKIAEFKPRDINRAENHLKIITSKLSFAEKAEYSYPRGGTNVIGPSIRLAEELCKCYGNIQYGINEVNKTQEETLYEVFCWDIENNIRVSRRFSQDHYRWKTDNKTKKKTKTLLTDSRDVYELVANNAARRLRAVILEVLPGWFVDDAIEQCRRTVNKDKTPIETRIAKILDMFEGLGVTQVMIEEKLNKEIGKIVAQDIQNLGLIYNSIASGVAHISEHFKLENKEQKIEDQLLELEKV